MTLTLIDLIGSIALLLWGIHMVQSGVQRAFGPQLRRLLGSALNNRFKAVLVGLGVTAVLQSSTATGLMVSSFAAGGLVDLVPALAVMLGANVGTTLIVQILSFDVGPIAPIFILIGVIMFRRGGVSRMHDLGRVAIGLGLMLMALHQLIALITPYENSSSTELILSTITHAPVIDLLFTLILTWAAHSSVAVVLLVMSLASKGLIPLDTSFALVIGANLGAAINPLLESTGNDPATKRLPIGNLVNRFVGCILVLGFLEVLAPAFARFEPNPARAIADFHTAFNLGLALLFFPWLGPFSRALRHWLPSQANATDPARPVYLTEFPHDKEGVPLALACAVREALRMSDALSEMIQDSLLVLDQNDRKRLAEIRRDDAILDSLNAAVKGYLTSLDEVHLGEADRRRLLQILTFTTNMEHAGDVIVRDVMDVAAKRVERGLAFSKEGENEIRTMLQRLAVNVRSAAAVFLTSDPRAARRLADEKEEFRNLEETAAEAHFDRLRAGKIESAETSTLHLDLIRDLKRVNAHLVSAAAYPVLKGQGELLPSRLKTNGETPGKG